MSDNHKIPSLIGIEETVQAAPFEQHGNPIRKSCSNCIHHRVGGQKGSHTFCEARGIPTVNLGLSLDQQHKTREIIAGSCDRFEFDDLSRPNAISADGKPENIDHIVFFPLMEVQNIPNPRGPKSTPSTCLQCIFFTRRVGYDLDLGFPFPESTAYCSRRGLILSATNSLRQKAASCDEGTMRGSGVSLSLVASRARLVPEYNADYINQIMAAEQLAAEAEEQQSKEALEALRIANLRSNAPWVPGWEPTTHVSEFEVDEDSKLQGIRAWYSVRDPEGTGNTVLIPIFDREFFSPEEQAKIPSSADDERPQDYVDHQGLIYNILVAWMELDETPALVGPAGTGKTEVLRTIAWMMQVPFERISITGSTELDDLQGKMLFKDGETKFQYGRLSAAWTKPNVICLDEPNVGPPEVWQFIRPLTDNSKQLVVDANSGERLIRNNNCFPGLAMNPAWDTKNIGAEFIADADSSRLLHIETRLPSWEVERKIIKHRCELDGFDIPDILLDVMRDVSSDLRAMSDKGEIPISWGIRSQIKAARLLKWFKVERAFLQAGISSLEPSVREVVMDLIKTRTGDIAKRYADEQRVKRMREAALKNKTEVGDSSHGEWYTMREQQPVEQDAAINRAKHQVPATPPPPTPGSFAPGGYVPTNGPMNPAPWVGLSTGF